MERLMEVTLSPSLTVPPVSNVISDEIIPLGCILRTTEADLHVTIRHRDPPCSLCMCSTLESGGDLRVFCAAVVVISMLLGSSIEYWRREMYRKRQERIIRAEEAAKILANAWKTEIKEMIFQALKHNTEEEKAIRKDSS